MKKMFFAFLLLALSFPLFAAGDYSKLSREQKAAMCYGRIRLVYSGGADFRVGISNSPDLRVRLVNMNAHSIGEWRLVDSSGDFTVQIVKSDYDFTIAFVH